MRQRKFRWIVAGLSFCMLVLFVAAWPAWSQGLTLRQILSGNQVPTTILAKDLTSDFRVVRVGDGEMQAVLEMSMFGMRRPNDRGGDYYTKGEIVKAGEVSYIIAYRIEEDLTEWRRQVREHRQPDNTSPTPQKLGPTEELKLALLNVKAVGSIRDMREFVPARDVMTEQEERAFKINRANSQSDARLKQIGQAMAQYIQDYDQRFPPMNGATAFAQISTEDEPNVGREETQTFYASSNAMSVLPVEAGTTRSTPVQKRMLPYLRDPQQFRHPVTKELYRFNIKISYHVALESDDGGMFPVAYEGTAAPDGTRGVVFGDGEARRVGKSEWVDLQKNTGVNSSSQPPPLPKPPSAADIVKHDNEVSVKNLKQLSMGLQMYMQDYDEVIPPMRPAASVRNIQAKVQKGRNGSDSTSSIFEILYVYVRNLKIFGRPGAQEAYRPNQSLSGHRLRDIERPAEIVAFYEGAPAADGTRAIAYLDGHVKRERETDWPRIAKRSGVPYLAARKPSNVKTSQRGRSPGIAYQRRRSRR